MPEGDTDQEDSWDVGVGKVKTLTSQRKDEKLNSKEVLMQQQCQGVLGGLYCRVDQHLMPRLEEQEARKTSAEERRARQDANTLAFNTVYFSTVLNTASV